MLMNNWDFFSCDFFTSTVDKDFVSVESEEFKFWKYVEIMLSFLVDYAGNLIRIYQRARVVSFGILWFESNWDLTEFINFIPHD